MKTLVLFTIIVSLAGCQADESDTHKISAQPIPPQYPQTPPIKPPSRTVATPANDIIYKCALPDGTTVYSDKNCSALAKSIDLAQSQPTPKKPPVPAYTYTPPTVTLPSSDTSTQHHKASSYEINTRYDNLTREIKGLFDPQHQFQCDRALLTLEQDRTNALGMYADAKQTHDINTRFDNLAVDARAKNKDMALTYQLLRIEEMRNQALYTQ